MAEQSEKQKNNNTLDLTSEIDSQKKEVVFPDGSKSVMRTVGEFSIKELKRLRSLQEGDNDIQDMVEVLGTILVDADPEQIESLSVDACNRIIGFFSAEAEEVAPTRTPTQSRTSKGSSGGRSKSG